MSKDWSLSGSTRIRVSAALGGSAFGFAGGISVSKGKSQEGSVVLVFVMTLLKDGLRSLTVVPPDSGKVVLIPDG